MAIVSGATTTKRDNKKPTQAQPTRPAPAPRIPAGWGNTAALTGANNARGINQANYTPPAAPTRNQWGVPQINTGVPQINTGSPSTFSFDRAILNAFGVGPPAAPAVSPGYQVPAISKNIAERYADWMNYDWNAALGYNSFLLPAPDFYTTDNTPKSGGGGGYGYGGGGGGGRGGGYSNDYNQWVRDLLTRWNIG